MPLAPITVTPSDNIFKELGNNTYDFLDLISEFIDNSIANRREGFPLEVDLTIGISEDVSRRWLCIRDNASGIPRDILPTAISPGASRGKGLNEHGLGMKQAVATLGTLDYLLTKTTADEEAWRIGEFKYGEIVPEAIDVMWSSGTELRVKDLNPIVPLKQRDYERYLLKQLGARYRRFLLPDNRLMDLRFQLIDVDDNDRQLFLKSIEQNQPIYFHPNSRLNKPVISAKEFSGNGWKARLTFGYAPTKDELAALGLDHDRFGPYYVSLKNQGFDIILHDRVIQFHALSSIGLVESPHQDYNSIRGEIDLESGFATAITKNALIKDEHFLELIDTLKDFLDKNKYLLKKTYPDEIPEALLRDRLKALLKRPPYSKKDVNTEVVVQGLEGYIDVLADEEAWEVKRGDAKGLDVFQLFAYLDMSHREKGYLIAKSFTTGAEIAAKWVKDKHSKSIELVPIRDMAIAQPPTNEEREKYY